jgi:hypothetical protein
MLACFPANMEQLEMHFDPAHGLDLPLGPRRYRFTRDALVVDYDGRQLLFGLWNRLHGFWHRYPAGGSDEVVPHHWWQPLNEQGVWSLSENAPNSRVDFVPGSGKSRLRYEANAAFVAYFDAIPRRIRRLVGRLESYQWMALDLIWQVPEFAAFLDDDIHEGSIQYFFACSALANEIYACCDVADPLTMSRADRREFAISIMKTRRPEFLTRLSGIECTKSSLRMLSKLGNTAYLPQYYRALLEAARDPAAAKVLAHASQINPIGIRAWLALPVPARLPNLLEILIAEADLAGELAAIILQFSNDRPEIWHRMGQSLSKIREADQITKWCDRWNSRILGEVDFPKPPFAGCGRLRPLSSGPEMKRESREMRNCLDDLIGDVLWDGAYFYHWGGAQPATIMLETCPEQGWRVGQILGPGNEEVDAGLAGHITDLIGQRLRPTPTEIPQQSSRESLISCMPTN